MPITKDFEEWRQVTAKDFLQQIRNCRFNCEISFFAEYNGAYTSTCKNST
jgi:hypothetical protein